MCDAEVTFLDVDTRNTTTIRSGSLTIAESSITLTAQQLKENRHYNVTITASNIDHRSIVSQAMISKAVNQLITFISLNVVNIQVLMT